MSIPDSHIPKPWLFLFLTIAAIWGSSFLFTRVAVTEFGVLCLTFLRVAIGAAVLLPFVVLRGLGGQLFAHWRAIAFIGVVNTGIPFACYSFALLHINTGLAAILNATVPTISGLIGYLWLKQSLTRLRWLGIVLGFAGIALLVSEQAQTKSDWLWSLLAIAACLVATSCYALMGHKLKRDYAHIHPWVTAAGSLLFAALFLLIPALWTLPAAMPSAKAWGSAFMAGAVCSGLAYGLYYELFARTDAQRVMSVTYLIPVFALIYGSLFLAEQVTWWMLACGGIVLLGTALTTGLITGSRRANSSAA